VMVLAGGGDISGDGWGIEVTSWWELDVLWDTIRQSPGIVDAH